MCIHVYLKFNSEKEKEKPNLYVAELFIDFCIFTWPLADDTLGNHCCADGHFTAIIFYVGLYVLTAEFKVLTCILLIENRINLRDL